MSRSGSLTRVGAGTIVTCLRRRVAKTVRGHVAMGSGLHHGEIGIVHRHATRIARRREKKTNAELPASILRCPATAKGAACLALRCVSQDSLADREDPAILVGQEVLQGRRWSLGPGCGKAIPRCSS